MRVFSAFKCAPHALALAAFLLALANPIKAAFTTKPGGPVLIITSSSNPFTQYYAEILLTEGLNEFATMDISGVTTSNLSSYDVVILGQMPLTSSQVTMVTNRVQSGGQPDRDATRHTIGHNLRPDL